MNNHQFKLTLFLFLDQKYCDQCKSFILSRNWHHHMRSNRHKNNALETTSSKEIQVINCAFQNRIISYKISPISFYVHVKDFFEEIMPKLTNLLNSGLLQHTCIKVNLELFGIYLNPNDESHHIKSFNTPYRVLCDSSDVSKEVLQMVEIIDRKSDELAEKDSGKI